MACEHKRLKSVNCVIMCADCGKVLDSEALALCSAKAAGETMRQGISNAANAGAEVLKKKRTGRKKKGEGETNG